MVGRCGDDLLTITLADDIPPGTHTLRVRYSGDTQYAPSTTTQTLTVTPAATTTSLSLTKTSMTTGRTVRAAVEVTSHTRAPVGGTVTLQITGPGTATDTRTVTLDATGRAKIDLGPYTQPGTLTATATFSGTPTNQPSTSTTESLVITLDS